MTGRPVAPTVRPFRIDGPLPGGTTVLEASAGTGKTYAIEALAVRYVAEGIAPLERLLLITFGRNATAELRDRVRRRFVAVTRALDAARGDPSGSGRDDDDLVRHLRFGDPVEVAARLRRLQAAVVSFDASTIETTHGFCNHMLAVLGLAADAAPTPTMIEDSDDVVTEVVTDLFVERFGRPDSSDPAVEHGRAVTLARAAVGLPDAVVEPTGADPDTEPGQRASLTTAARAEVLARKRRRGLRDYDDMLVDLRDALRSPGLAEIARRRLRSRYQIVLVDEFQDTDPIQWDILSAAFHGHATLILVGDPKQAIYAFRGADVRTYQEATAVADAQWTLPVNHRSDAALVGAVLDVVGRASLGDGITAPHVTAAHQDRRLSGGRIGAPLRLRLGDRSQVPLTKAGLVTTRAMRDLIAADVARDIVAHLDSDTRFDPGTGSRALLAGDIAVLVRTNDQGVRVRNALTSAGVPVTLSGAASVFRSAAAADWLSVLAAMEQPHRSGLIGRAALSVFMGWTADRLGRAVPEQLDALTATIRDWARVLEQRGVPALTEVMFAAFELPRRVLSTVGGERLLTDVRHVAQASHVASSDDHRGVAALTTWLRQQILDASGDPSEERSQRLDSDAEAVQVLTIHRSKGLQYPIVYVPFLWDRYSGRAPDPLRFHRPDGRRVLDVGGPNSPRPAQWSALADAEQFGEDLRLLYVAFTRAIGQVVAWWAPSSNTPCSPLHRVLFGEPVEGSLPHDVAIPDDATARRVLQALADRSGGAVSIESAGIGPVPALAARPPVPGRLGVRAFDRPIDDGWQRTSYTRLIRGLHDNPPGAGSEADGVFSEDEPPSDPSLADLSLADPSPADPLRVAQRPAGAGSIGEGSIATGSIATGPGDSVAAEAEQALRVVVSPMADFPGGAAFGTFVHSVLDGTDMTAADLVGELTARAEEVSGRLPVRVPPSDLAAALAATISTPLGPLAGGRRLRDITSSDRLDELAFELPLAGGDLAGGSVGAGLLGSRGAGLLGSGSSGAVGAVAGDIAALLRRWLPPRDVLAGYADRLDDPMLAGRRMLGYLTGSIDAVLRVRDFDGSPSYLIVDYKTNWLGESRTQPLTAWHYRPAALVTEMLQAHYPLQALLYCVALHRYLRLRQPGYLPHRHLGGVLYLFVRGMCGEETPVVAGTPTGVFSWRPPAGLIEELSTLLDTGMPVDGAADRGV